MIEIEVAYGQSSRQVIVPLRVSALCTVEEAIQLSGILQQFPEINLTCNKVGIFSKIVTLNKTVQPGDRIEIYRSLTIDPKQARLLRAQRSGKR